MVLCFNVLTSSVHYDVFSWKIVCFLVYRCNRNSWLDENKGDLRCEILQPCFVRACLSVCLSVCLSASSDNIVTVFMRYRSRFWRESSSVLYVLLAAMCLITSIIVQFYRFTSHHQQINLIIFFLPGFALQLLCGRRDWQVRQLQLPWWDVR